MGDFSLIGKSPALMLREDQYAVPLYIKDTAAPGYQCGFDPDRFFNFCRHTVSI